MMGFIIGTLSCSDKLSEHHDPPVFVSSLPTSGSKDVTIDSNIEVTFNEVISVVKPDAITINGGQAGVSVSLSKLRFDVNLEEGMEYNIVIPKESIVNEKGIELSQQIQISFTTAAKPINVIKETLVTQNPSAQAVNVYNYLREIYGKKILSTTEASPAWNINEAEWVNYHTGKYPAMVAMDYIFLASSPANWIDYNQISFIENWWNNNGLISASWHWNVPPNTTITDVNKFAFRTKNADGVKVEFKPSNVPIEGTWENGIAKADFDKLIDYLKLLQNKNIPIIWRPLHEASGNIYQYANGKAWFWWGAESGAAYISLWRYMFNYFKEKGVNNLIWVWTTQTKDNDYYPGDEYVDIIGKDVYDQNDANKLANIFKSIQEAYPDKMVTLSECGNVATITSQWNLDAKWSWFMPWNDPITKVLNSTEFYQTNHKYANVAWWNNALDFENVITLDEMPDLK